MNRNRTLVFFTALVVLGGLGFVVYKMFETDGAPKHTVETSGPAKTSPTASPTTERPAPITAKPGETPTITPKTISEPPVYAQDAGLGGVVQNEAGARIEGAICELYEDTGAIKDKTQEGDLRDKQLSNSEGLFLFDRMALSLADRFVVKVIHPMFMTERKAVDLKKLEGPILYVTLRLGTSISGTVKTSAGAPVGSATVTVYDMNQGALDPNGSVETFATTDNTGAYTINHVCAGMKKVQASAAGHATADRQAVQVEQGKPLAGIDFALNDGAGISGKIMASDGSAIANANVTARPIRIGPREQPGEPPPAVREMQARREADVKAREHAIQSNDSGMREKEQAEQDEEARINKMKGAETGDVKIDEKVALQIQREREAAIKAAGGNPAGVNPNPNLKRSFVTPQPSNVHTVVSVRSNPDGTFNIPGTEFGTYIVSVAAVGYVPPPQQQAESPSQGLTFQMAPNAHILGRVIDGETGTPVPMFTLGITTAPDEVLVPVHSKKSFGPPRFADGTFDYVDVKPGRYWLVADAPGFAGGRSDEIVITQGETRTGVEVKLVRGATIKGRVMDARGGGVANATVQPDPASLSGNGAAGLFVGMLLQNMRRDIREVKTDAEGRYTIPNMLSGSYTLTVRHPDYGPQATPAFTVPASGDFNQPDIQLSRGATIKGRVKLPDGQPDGQAMVQIAPVGTTTPNFLGNRNSYTNSDGRFEITGLAVGQYRVNVVQRKGQPDLSGLFGALKNPNLVTLGEGEVKEIDL